jgi:hypothetical protein
MDQPANLEGLLTDIVNCHRTLVEEIRKIREWYDYVRRMQRRLLIILPIVLFALLLLLAGTIIVAVNFNGTAEVETPWERQSRQYQKLLDREDQQLDRAELQAKRFEELQQRWQRQADRIDAVITKWEKAAPKE